MSILVIQIPPRQRLRARSPGAVEPAGRAPGQEYDYVLSDDVMTPLAEGRSAPALWPKAGQVVAALSETDVSWHRITCPKAPTARLRAALVGVLEDALLADTDTVHLALAPDAVAGQPTWVAAVDRGWLRVELAALELAQIFPDRVVPMAWPDDPPSGHFALADANDPATATLTWSHAGGVAQLRLQGGLARAMISSPPPPGTRWSATPGAAAVADGWLGAPVSVTAAGPRLLQAARSLWNLRQFDLARRNRGARALGDSLRQFFSAAWRPVRYGLLALLLVQVAGLNLWAWQQQRAIEAKRTAIAGLVKATYPKAGELDIQRDAAAVMKRESQALRSRAGQPGDDDLETMLEAAATAWPAERGPVNGVKFEPGKLSLAAAGWTEPQVARFRDLLRAGGWQVDAADDRLILTRSRAAGVS